MASPGMNAKRREQPRSSAEDRADNSQHPSASRQHGPDIAAARRGFEGVLAASPAKAGGARMLPKRPTSAPVGLGLRGVTFAVKPIVAAGHEIRLDVNASERIEGSESVFSAQSSPP